MAAKRKTSEPYTIEKGIERQSARSRNGKSKYPFDRMGVGDSFAFPERQRSAIASAANGFSKRSGFKFSTTKDRIWRVK